MPSHPEYSITLYSNPTCPFVHRALIALDELSIPYKPVYIDLETPREPWYLDINPRGTVPSLALASPGYNNGKDVIVTESLVIINFLADLVPGLLLPQLAGDKGVEAVVERARVAFFVDTWTGKIETPLLRAALASVSGEEALAAAVDGVVELVEKEIEPLLAKKEGDGDGPFFGGKDKFTIAEVLVAPFILRNFSWAENEILPLSLKQRLLALPNFGRWAEALLKNENVLKHYDEKLGIEKTRKKLEAFKAGTFKVKGINA